MILEGRTDVGSGYQHHRPARNQPEPADAEVSQVPLYGSFRSQRVNNRAPRREEKWFSYLSGTAGRKVVLVCHYNLHTKRRVTQFHCSPCEILSAASSRPARLGSASPGYIKYTDTPISRLRLVNRCTDNRIPWV